MVDGNSINSKNNEKKSLIVETAEILEVVKLVRLLGDIDCHSHERI